MNQFIFNQTLSPVRSVSKFFCSLRKKILRHSDPIVIYNLNGKDIRIRLSHELPQALKTFPAYSSNLKRLASFIRSKAGQLKMIDVGANVGDSFCLAGEGDKDQFLLIEGDEAYFDLLKQNTERYPSVTLVKTFISDQPGDASGSFVSQSGTGKLVSKPGSTIQFQTVDQITAQQKKFGPCNLLKSDVDGYDCRVLRGARQLIASTKPVLFFEHDPVLLKEAGENPVSIFEFLAELGYDRLVFYDFLGGIMGQVDSRDTVLLGDLMFYASMKQNWYYDICCFHRDQAAWRADFIAEERKSLVSLGRIQ